MKNNKLVFFLAIVVLCSSNCIVNKYNKINKAVEQSQVSPRHFKQEIALDESKNNLVIKVKIQGKTYNFLLDSGYDYCVLDTELAAMLQVKQRLNIPIFDNNNQKITHSYVELEKVDIGNLNFSKVIFAVDNMNCRSCYPCQRLDGVIGTNLMAKAIWQIDYLNQKAIIASHQDSLPLLKNKKTVNFHTYYGYGMGRPMVALRAYNNYLCDAVIGTSYCGGIWLHHSLIKRIAQASKSCQVYHLRDAALGNQQDTAKIFLLPKLNIGNIFDINNSIVNSYKYEYSVIGYNFLKNYTLVFDWQKQQIAFSETSELDFETFGYYIKYANDKVIVSSIFQQSPAEKAGLRLSDHVVKINDQDLTNLTLEGYCNLKNPYLSNEVHLTVKRGEQLIDFIIPKTDERTLIR